METNNTAPSAPQQNWRLYLELASLAGLILPFGNILGPLILWMVKKDQEADVKLHGPASLNFHISWTIWSLVTCGLGGLVYLVFWIIRLVKVSKGEDYVAPLTLTIIK